MKAIENIFKHYNMSLPEDPKELAHELKIVFINFLKLEEAINKDGAVFISETLLVYNKSLGAFRLTVSPQIGENVVKEIRFDPDDLFHLLSLDYYVTGTSLTIKDKYRINVLIVAKDKTEAVSLKGRLKL